MSSPDVPSNGAPRHRHVPPPEPPDRADVLAAVMPALLGSDVASHGDPDRVGGARIVTVGDGIVAGLPVVREAFGRLGARTRVLAHDGSRVVNGQVVAEVGGPLAAIHAAGPVALRFLTRLSAVAAGARSPEPGDALDAYAARLSAPAPVGDDGPSFRLDFEG